MFVNVPIRVVVYALGSRVLPETARHHGTFDLTGAITSVLGMGSLVQGFVNAASDGWSAPVTIGSFGFGMLALFVLTELHAQEPITPLRLLAGRSRTSANIARGQA